MDLRSRWQALDRPRRLALIGIAIAAVGALGPWSSGRLIYGLTGNESRAENVWGFDSGGMLMLILLATAGWTLVGMNRSRLRTIIASLALGVVMAIALWLIPSGGSFTFLASYQVDRLAWGLPAVIIGCLLAVVGTIGAGGRSYSTSA